LTAAGPPLFLNAKCDIQVSAPEKYCRSRRHAARSQARGGNRGGFGRPGPGNRPEKTAFMKGLRHLPFASPVGALGDRGQIREEAMILNPTQAVMVEHQLGAMVLADDHPLTHRFTELYGEHTFLLDDNGLNILEPNDAPLQSTARVINLGSWTNDEHKELRIHKPLALAVEVELGPSPTDTIH
jgi:hypothetical protein